MKTLSMLLAGVFLAALSAPALADDGPDVTLQLEDADIIDVIQMIAGMAKVNVIVSPKVKGTVTVSFTNTPWRKALETVVRSKGHELVEEDFGIYTVLPKAEARKQIEYRKRTAEKRYAELTAELDAVKMRLAEAKLAADGVAAKRAKVDADDARLLAEATTLRRLHADADLNKQVLQIHAIGDLGKNGLDIEKVGREVLGKGVTEMRHDKGVLIVRATPTAHKRLAGYLGKLRTWKPAGGNLVTGRVITTFGETDDKARVVVRTKKADPLKTEVYTTWKKTGKMPTFLTTKRNGELYVSNDDGRTWVKRDQAYKDGDHDFKVAYLSIPSPADEVALKARAEKLRKAAALLESAGDKAGAARVRKQAAAALQQMAEQRKQMERARVKFEVASRSVMRRKSSGNVLGAVEGLRKEVGALRQDVRELTALVRKLVERRR